MGNQGMSLENGLVKRFIQMNAPGNNCKMEKKYMVKHRQERGKQGGGMMQAKKRKENCI